MKTQTIFGKGLMVLAVLWVQVYPAQAQTIPVQTQHSALVMKADGHKDVHIIYFGKKLASAQEYDLVSASYRQPSDYTGLLNSAYTPSGSRNLMEPALTVSHSDGNTSLDLRFAGYKTEKLSNDIELTRIFLKDSVYHFEVTLNYKAYYAEDVVEQWSEIRHQEKGPVVLHKYASANLYLKAKTFYLRQYHGDWAREMQPEEAPLTHGIKTLDSKLGTRANLFQPPVFMIAPNHPAMEDEGEVIYGSLEWSGNFRIDLELDNQDNLRVIAGMNNYASPYTLQRNELFTTPKFLYTYSANGKGEASRKLQRWARDYRLVDGHGTRLTLLNNWESTYFDFDEAKLKELLSDTKKLGVDLFLLDDGWFGNKYPRNGDRAGLGDWQPNRQKLPNGIASLVRESENQGVKFGIWIEPEMVNPKSELYEKHPDWVIKQPRREEYYFRNQLVLDLSNPRVQDFVYGVVDSLFTKNPGLAYIKWDCNAVIYNAYSAHLKNQSHLHIEYVRGLYKVLERIRTKYPTVPMMLCSGGGGRVDYAALQYFTEYWPSDNTDPLERIFIQWEYSYFFPALASSNHVTDWGKQPLKFRTDVAMMGKLGFDIPVSRLEARDLSFCQGAVKTYDSIKQVIFQGDQYRLSDPRESEVASMLYMDSGKTSGVLFHYLVSNRYGAGSALPIRLKGLDPSRFYTLREINLYPGTRSGIDGGKRYSGDFLMTVGFNPMVNAGRSSVVVWLSEVQ